MGQVVQYREVLYNLLARDLKLKYKRTALGYFWSLLNPVLQLAVLTAVFSHIVRLEMKDYTLYLFSGLLAWTFFQTSLILCGVSYLENENFIKKIYLPKILFPMSKVCLRGIDFVFSLVALSLVGAVAGFSLHWTVALLPAAAVLLCGFTLGVGIIVAVGTVFFRDFQYLITVFLQLLYFATPILYPLSVLPENYQFYMQLNPLVSQLRLFQRLIHEGVVPSGMEWLTAAVVSVAVLSFGLWILFKTEDELVFRI